MNVGINFLGMTIMRSKRIKKSVMCVLLIGCMLLPVGCGSGEKPIEEAGQISKFSWEMSKGSSIKVLLNQHPYADAIIKKIPEFEKKTGISVSYSVTPEENYYDKVTTALSSHFRSPDVFMAGPLQLWEYISSGYIQSLDELIQNPKLTSADYEVTDFYPGVLGSLKWDNISGHKVGSGPLWGIPIGFEMYNLAYNKRIFSERNIKPPKTMEELLDLCYRLKEFNGKGSYALALRGSRNWPTITTSYISTYVNYGAKDYEIINGRLVSRVNSQEAVNMTDMWVKLIRSGGAPSWASYTWYQAGADFGAGEAAMLLDADLSGYFQNFEAFSKEAGNIAWVKAPLPAGMDKGVSNLWCWGLSMNKATKNSIASWIFIQYFTSKEYLRWASLNAMVVNPARRSVFESSQFQAALEKAQGYARAFQETIDNSTIVFTPNPHFFETTTLWAEVLQDIVNGKYKSTQDGMDALKHKMDQAVSNVEVKN